MMRRRWNVLILGGCLVAPLWAQGPEVPVAHGNSDNPGSPGNPGLSGTPVTSGAPAVQVPEVDAEAAAEAGEAPEAERYEGTFEEGTRELRRLALDGDTDGALALSDSLLVPGPLADLRARAERRTGGASERMLESLAEPLDWLGLPIDEGLYRAEVHYARGLVYALRSEIAPSDESFELARVLAGPGKTRLDAIYNQGNLDFAGGEALRQMIPEIVGEEAAVEPPEELTEDPLELARSAYLAAREHFVERLRADWRDGDTRANLELCLRRLRELDEVERQREEQEQQDEEQEQDQDSENQDSEDSEEQDSSDSQEGSEDESSEQEPSEDESEEPQPDEGEEQESEEDEESTDEEADEPQEPEESEDSTGQPEDQEKHLTAEEVKRLLERLQELDEKGEKLRESLRGVRRVPVKRDW